MGKRIIQQRRGRGTLTYRARGKTFPLSYPDMEGEAKVLKLIHASGYNCPIAKLQLDGKIFYNIAVRGLVEGQTICVGKGIEKGNILPLKEIPTGTFVCNIEIIPKKGGRLVRTAGGSARIGKKTAKGIIILLPSKKEKLLPEKARATIGIVASGGIKEKPFMKAGKKYYAKRAKNKLWPRTSAVKMNIVDHPFGSGRGKRIKSKIAKRNAPPGRKVGLLRPKRTGKRK